MTQNLNRSLNRSSGLATSTSESGAPAIDDSPERKAEALDLAGDYLNFHIFRYGDREDGAGRRVLSIMSERSRLPSTPEIEPANSGRPDLGHGSAMAAAGAGAERGRPFGEFEIRPAYHALLDPERGYVPGAQIEFLDTAVRWRAEDGVYLQRFTFLNLTSLAPVNSFLRPVSWSFNSAIERRRLSENDNPLIGAVGGSAGLTVDAGSLGLIYGLAGPQVLFGREFESRYALGVEPRIGMLSFADERLAVNIEGHYGRFWLGDATSGYGAKAALRYSVSQNITVTIEDRADFFSGYYCNTAMIKAGVFF